MSQIDDVLNVMFGPRYTRRVDSTLRARYESSTIALWEIICSFFGVAASPPEPRIIYTATLRPQSITIQNQSYLVYDQYLGQVLNQMTRLEMNSPPSMAVDAHLFKLMGQRNYIAGHNDRAVNQGALAEILNDNLRERGFRLREIESRNPKTMWQRLRSTTCQEEFVIGHELAHDFLRLHQDVREMLKEQYLTVILPLYRETFESRVQESPEEAHQAYLEDVRRERERRTGVPVPEQVHQAEIARALREDPTAESHHEYLASEPQRWREVSESEELLEEVICDLLGVFSATRRLASHHVTLSNTTSGASLALHHLRLIQLMDSVVAGSYFEDSAGDTSDPFVFSRVRLSLFRFASAYVAQEFLGGSRPKLGRLIRRRMVEGNLMHSKVLLDPLIFHIIPRLDEYESAFDGLDLPHDRAYIRSVLDIE